MFQARFFLDLLSEVVKDSVFLLHWAPLQVCNGTYDLSLAILAVPPFYAPLDFLQDNPVVHQKPCIPVADVEEVSAVLA